jgi:hypothetical protein
MGVFKIMLKAKCPKCGKTLTRTADFPDTGTSVDIFEARCKSGHKFVVSIELQDNSVSLQEID